jgi:hypothetical protein
VTLDPAPTPTFALLDVEFHNANHLHRCRRSPTSIERRHAFARRHRSGPGAVTSVAAGPTPNTLRLRLEPIGDYSTYTLSIDGRSSIRCSAACRSSSAGCFNLNCAPSGTPPAPPASRRSTTCARLRSFRHVLIAAMMQRVPDWQPTSEADLDQVLIDVVAADADELADYQDRVMNEAYFASRASACRSRATPVSWTIHPRGQPGEHLARGQGASRSHAAVEVRCGPVTSGMSRTASSSPARRAEVLHQPQRAADL